jgi:hypothetical protein
VSDYVFAGSTFSGFDTLEGFKNIATRDTVRSFPIISL